MPKRARKPRELPATATIPSAGFSRDDRIALEPPKAPADRYLQAPARRRAVPGYNGAASGHNNLELYAGRTQAAQMPLWGMLGDEDHIMPGDDWGTWRPLYVNRVQHPTRRRLLTRQEREQLYIKRIDADIQAKYYAKHHQLGILYQYYAKRHQTGILYKHPKDSIEGGSSSSCSTYYYYAYHYTTITQLRQGSHHSYLCEAPW